MRFWIRVSEFGVSGSGFGFGFWFWGFGVVGYRREAGHTVGGFITKKCRGTRVWNGIGAIGEEGEGCHVLSHTAMVGGSDIICQTMTELI